ncbi:hypothetical protein HVY60_13005 [Citrobacter freundii]|uniref:hypothetical protein n=1 Tax=Citrobacter freundii TaxID=546 RepID=UPI0015EEF192|nr:hypothetical protein [Citrobacter freundii]QMG41441.1 hypothetical protein HVY60_13005 [Citrobacter freundii]
MNTLLTIFTAVATFIVTQIVLKFFIDPLLELKKAIMNVERILSINGARLYDPNNLDTEKLEELRVASALLEAAYGLIPARRFYSSMGLIPDFYQIAEARDNLSKLYRCNESTTKIDAESIILKIRTSLLIIKEHKPLIPFKMNRYQSGKFRYQSNRSQFQSKKSRKR